MNVFRMPSKISYMPTLARVPLVCHPWCKKLYNTICGHFFVLSSKRLYTHDSY